MKSHLTVILSMITDKYILMKQPILNTAYMTAAFNLQMQNENESSNIKDMNTEYMYNMGQPMSEGHNMSVQAIQSEIYNEEQNEIL